MQHFLHDSCFNAFAPPSPRQVLLDRNAWLQWRIPYFNSHSHGLAATLASLIFAALTAIYFIRSAVSTCTALSSKR